MEGNTRIIERATSCPGSRPARVGPRPAYPDSLVQARAELRLVRGARRLFGGRLATTTADRVTSSTGRRRKQRIALAGGVQVRLRRSPTAKYRYCWAADYDQGRFGVLMKLSGSLRLEDTRRSLRALTLTRWPEYVLCQHERRKPRALSLPVGGEVRIDEQIVDTTAGRLRRRD